jgi:hypothetical protein
MRLICFFIGRFCLQATTLETVLRAERTAENIAVVGRGFRRSNAVRDAVKRRKVDGGRTGRFTKVECTSE